MDQLRYLTVQDVLWINLQCTGKVRHFSFAKLEEAVFCQYAYGERTGAVAQGSRFVSGILRMSPFEAGNRATAFVAWLSFLRLNGLALKVSDEAAAARFARIEARADSPAEAVSGVAEEVGPASSVREAIAEVLGAFPCTAAALFREESPAPGG